MGEHLKLNTFFTFFQTSMKYQYWLHPPSRRRQQGSFMSREPAGGVYWWTICGTEEVSSVDSIKGEKMDCISSKPLCLCRPEPLKVPKEQLAKSKIIQVGVISGRELETQDFGHQVAKRPESSFAEKDFRVLVDITLTMTMTITSVPL